MKTELQYTKKELSELGEKRTHYAIESAKLQATVQKANDMIAHLDKTHTDDKHQVYIIFVNEFDFF